MQPGSSHSQPASTWTEPPWSGWIETTGDALLILEAARRGLIPRVTRRLVDSERKMITSGSVFVFDEDESGIKRWTDGFYWSPSRILGNFLLYRETEKRGAGHRGARSDPDMDQVQYNTEGVKVEGQTLSRPKHDGLGVDKHRERTLMGSLTNSYKFKPDGLMKKTFSLTIGGVAQHLISYYKIEDVENGRLRAPSSLPELASLEISPEYLDKTHFRNPPKVEIGVDGIPRYRGEADDIESSPSILTNPLSSGLPLITDERVVEGSSAPKRGKRFDPYNNQPSSSSSPTERRRKGTKSSSPAVAAPGPESSSPNVAAPISPPNQQLPQPQPYLEASLPVTHPNSYPPPPFAGYYQVSPYGPPQPHPHPYPPASYPHLPQQPQQHPPNAQYPYSAYATPVPMPPGNDQAQNGQQQAQPYYPYYTPAPHPSYSGYPAAVPWPHYAGYPPQASPYPPPPRPAEDQKAGGSVESESTEGSS